MEVLGFHVPMWALLTTLCIVIAYWYVTKTFDVFRKHGIPGPRPWPVVGNLFDFYRYGVREAQCKWVESYGKVFGVFVGSTPTLVISDLDIIKRVLVKDFSNFMDRRRLPIKLDPPFQDMLNSANGDTWRRIRHLLSPGFSTGKLRQMIPHMNDATDTLVENLHSAAVDGKNVQIKDVVSCFTMDVIAATAFGMKLNTQKDPENPFVKNTKKFFVVRKTTILMFLLPTLGKIMNKWLGISLMDPYLATFMKNLCVKLMQERREKDIGQKDFLQLMMNAHKEEHHDETAKDDGKDTTDQKKDSRPRKEMTTDEIIAQIALFFLAGFETTASTMTFLLYFLAINPEAQDRLAQEVDEVLGDTAKVSSEQVGEMPYLDMCIQETLRMYGPTSRLTRIADKTVTIDGLTIPAGMQVLTPLYFLHHDPAVWSDPMKFIPERFTQEAKADRHPFQHMPFGEGPRNCIGERMAKLEIKIAISRLIQRYRFEPSAETEIPLRMSKMELPTPLTPIQLRVVERSQ